MDVICIAADSHKSYAFCDVEKYSASEGESKEDDGCALMTNG